MHNSHLKRLRRCLFFADPELINGWKVYTSKRSSCLNDRRFRIKWFFLIHCCCQCRYLFTPLRYLPKEGHKDRLLHDKQNKNLHTLYVNAQNNLRGGRMYVRWGIWHIVGLDWLRLSITNRGLTLFCPNISGYGLGGSFVYFRHNVLVQKYTTTLKSGLKGALL